MTKQELINRLVDNHNRISSIEVHGEGAILVADTMRDLRLLIKQLQAEATQDNTNE